MCVCVCDARGICDALPLRNFISVYILQLDYFCCSIYRGRILSVGKEVLTPTKDYTHNCLLKQPGKLFAKVWEVCFLGLWGLIVIVQLHQSGLYQP